jgi:hypothetical protein
MIMADLAIAHSQRLVPVKGVSTTPTDRYEAVDPLRAPPRYRT